MLCPGTPARKINRLASPTIDRVIETNQPETRTRQGQGVRDVVERRDSNHEDPEYSQAVRLRRRERS
jgi:hypothetical protein